MSVPGDARRQVRVAAVQAASVFLDREATIDRVAELTAKAAGDGARLVLFPETFVPGYPDWVWRTGPWRDAAWFARLADQAVTVPGEALDRLAEIAADNEVHLAVGIDEREPNGSTIYNTLVYLGPDGTYLGKHRKLMPTGGERLVWGMGDGSTLTVIDTPFGRVGGLICWENYMPLARAAMYARGIDILLAPTWDNSDVWVPTLRHIAREGRVHVIGATPCQHGLSVPADLPHRDELYPGGDDDWMSRGNSTVVGPDGDVLAGPLVGEEGIVLADLDLDAARESRRQFDPVGHYSRPDVFRLDVDVQPKPGVVFSGGPPAEG
jgi:nitrilase